VQKVFHSINSRILLIPIIALIALIVAGLVSIQTIANVTLQEHQARPARWRMHRRRSSNI